MFALVSALMPRKGRRSLWFAVFLCLTSMSIVQSAVSLSVPVIVEFGVISTSSLRLCWAAGVLCLLIRPPMRQYTKAQWQAALMLGCSMALMTVTFFMAVERLPQHLAVALEFCGPLTVAALGVKGWRALLWPLLAAIGIVLLVWTGAHLEADVDPLGVVFAFVAATGWAGYIVMMKKVGHAFPGFQGLATSLLVAALVSLPFAVVEVGTLAFPWEQLAWTAGLAVMLPLVPYLLEMSALRRLPAAAFGVLMSLEPAAGAIAGWLILGQMMDGNQILGTLLVIIASIGVVRASAG